MRAPSLREPVTAWRSTQQTGHPLVGKVWRLGQTRLTAIDDPAWRDDLATRPFLLLGEVHDNPDHHRLQAHALVGRGARGGPVVLEMLNDDQMGALAVQGRPRDGAEAARTADAFFKLVKWNASGWPPAALYRPIIEQAILEGLSLRAGSAARRDVRRIGRQGLDVWLDAKRRAALGLTPLGPAEQAALERELMVGHCNLMPARMIPSMVDVQRFRDARMADAMLAPEPKRSGSQVSAPVSGAAGGPSPGAGPGPGPRDAQKPPSPGAVLIAGNGHVRADRAVPLYLMRRGIVRSAIAVIVHAEVEPGRTDAAAQVPRDPAGRPVADAVVFTPRMKRPDPCDQLRAMMERIRRNKKKP